MPASEISSFVPPAPNVGDGQITIIQPGTTPQVFHVNQDNNQEIVLRNDNDNTTYTAGDGLTLTGTEFSVKPANGTITVNSSGISVNVPALNISSGVTSITPGDGIRSGTASGPSNSTPITSDGALSVDDTVIRNSGNQTIAGIKKFTSQVDCEKGIKQAISSISQNASWNLSSTNMWVTQNGVNTIANPVNTVAGMTGVIFCTSEVTTWGSYFLFPGGLPPVILANSVVPYYIKSSNQIMIGNPTTEIT